MVMDSSASTDKTSEAGVMPDRAERPSTTSSTPPKPSSKPSHCRARNLSPNSGALANAVRIGCMPTISALTPADMPR